jgi:hypothetical protein
MRVWRTESVLSFSGENDADLNRRMIEREVQSPPQLKISVNPEKTIKD